MANGIIAHLVAATTGATEAAAAMTVSMVLYPSGTVIVVPAIDMSALRTTRDAS